MSDPGYYLAVAHTHRANAVSSVIAMSDALKLADAEIESLRSQLAELREAARKALRLTEYADVSDDCQYGTLDTTLVRDSLADLRRLLGESHE